MGNKTSWLMISVVAVALLLGGVVFATPRVPVLRAAAQQLGLASAFQAETVAPAHSNSYAAAAIPAALPAAGGDLLADSSSQAAPPPIAVPLQAPKTTGGDDDAKDADAAKKDDAAEEAKDGDKKEEALPKTDEEWIAKLNEWKTEDPRKIIEEKYKDLEGRKTTPWNEDDPDNFIPETGRTDPLSPVIDALPDELKQLRGVEDDPNEIIGYLVAQACSEAVDGVLFSLKCHSVVQIGVNKIVTISAGGGRAQSVPEGGSFQFRIDTSQGIPVNVTISIASVSPDEIIISATGEVQGSPISITKDQNYIPTGMKV